MRYRRALVAFAAAVLLPLLAAGDCAPEQGGSGGTKPRIDAGQAKPPKDGGGAQPAPVQGDPSAHNTQHGEVDLHLSWTNRKNPAAPLCEWTKNGVGSPCANLHKAERDDPDDFYVGLWEFTTTGVSGDTFTLNAEGFGGTGCEASIFFKGHQVGSMTHAGTRCAALATLP